MQNIQVSRYDDGSTGVKNANSWAGYIEPDDMSWIIFVNNAGKNWLYTKRESTGAVIGDPVIW